MRLALFAIALCLWTSHAVAQPELRMESLGLPPMWGEVRDAAGRAYFSSHKGLHVFEPAAGAWRHLGEETRVFVGQPWAVHPDGRIIVAFPGRTAEYDPRGDRVSIHNDVVFSFRVSDSIVGRLSSTWPGDGSVIRCHWYRWPSMESVRVDSVVTKPERVYDVTIPCADGSILALSQTGICRFRFDRAPELEPLTDEIVTDQHTVYVDPERTHVVLRTRSGFLYSTDLFVTRSYVPFPVPPDSVRTIRCTADPNVLVAAHSRLVERIVHVPGSRDTLVRDLPSGFRNIAALNDTVILGIVDAVISVHNGLRVDVSAGLPERSVRRLLAVPGGIIASGDHEILVHASGGEWQRSAENLGVSRAFTPMGGRSLDDFWCVQGGTLVHVSPRTTMTMMAIAPLAHGHRGLYVGPRDRWFTFVNTDDQLSCGSEQVMWFSDGQPTRTLLCANDLRVFMVFHDSVHAALSYAGGGWRTTNVNLESWQKVTSPPFPNVTNMRMATKGDHGIAATLGFVMWTHDAGSTWHHRRVASTRTLYALANDGSFFVVRMGFHPDTALVVERWQDDNVTPIMVINAATAGDVNLLEDVAFDDEEQRLYIATTLWTASLVWPVSGVLVGHEEPSMPAPSLPLGYYDLFGRFVADDERDVAVSGLYLHVTADGVRRVVVTR